MELRIAFTLAVWLGCSGSVLAAEIGNHFDFPEAARPEWPFGGMLRNTGFHSSSLGAGRWGAGARINPTGNPVKPAFTVGESPAEASEGQADLPGNPMKAWPRNSPAPKPRQASIQKELKESKEQVQSDLALLSKLQGERDELKQINDGLIEEKRKRQAKHRWLLEAGEATGMNKKELLRLQTQKKTRDDKLAEMKANYESHSHTLSETLEENKKTAAAIEAITAEKTQLEIESKQLSSESEQMQKDIEELQTKLMTSFQQLDGQKQDLMKNYKEVAQENLKMEDDVQKNDQQSKDIAARKQDLEKRNGEVKLNIQDLEKAYSTLDEENAELLAKNKKLKGALNKLKGIITKSPAPA